MAENTNQRITRFRRFMGFTQADMAERLGMKTTTYSKKERNGKIDCELLIEISKILETDANILLFGGEPPENTQIAKSYSPMEESLITIIRNLPKKSREEVYAFVNIKYKSRRRKSS